MLEIIESDEESIDKFHDRGWGRTTHVITKEHINALLEGKAIGIDDGEYTHILVLKDAK